MIPDACHRQVKSGSSCVKGQRLLFMAETKFLGKLLERVDRVDRYQLENYLKGLVWENRFLKNSLNKLDIGVIILDKDAKIKSINNSAEMLLGLSEKRLQDRNISACPLDPVLLSVINKVIAKGDTYEQELYTTLPRDQILKLSMHSIKDIDEEEDMGWVVALQDMTEFRRTSTQKFQTEKLKALVTMAGILAHELGNPLNSLTIHLQLINRMLKGFPKKYKEKMSKILGITQTEVKRLDGIVTRFLQATRPLKSRFFEGDIHKIIDETLDLLGPELKRNKINVKKDYNTDIPKIYLDHIQIRQAFINIIKNALESMSKNGLLEIKTILNGETAAVSFTDTGTGMSEDEVSRIFEPYYSTKREGSGLGLVILHRIIRDHGGKIDVKSKIGVGTTMTIYLPIEISGPKLLTQEKK